MARDPRSHTGRFGRDITADVRIVVEERIIDSEGDLDESRPISLLGSTGVFVRRLETALLGQEVDLAVHSLKDLPTAQPDGLTLVAISERHDPRDAILSPQGYNLESLPKGAVLGTGSFRRRCQILSIRPDLKIVPIRGNLQTRRWRESRRSGRVATRQTRCADLASASGRGSH